MQCPNCHDTLLTIQRNRIDIDYCPACRGVWLDRTELDRILEHAEHSAPHEFPVMRGMGTQRTTNRQSKFRFTHSKPHNKRSFLSHLFDLG